MRYLTITFMAMMLGLVLCTTAKAAFFCNPISCLAPKYKLQNYACCCGGPCPVVDRETHRILKEVSAEYVKGFGGLQAATDATGLNVLVWMLSTGPIGEEIELGLGEIPSPISGFDPTIISYRSKCIMPIAMLVRDKVIPEPPEKLVESAGSLSPNPLYLTWLQKALAVQISNIISNPGTYRQQTQTEKLNQDWCRTRYVEDVGLITATMATQTLAMLENYRIRLAQYAVAFNTANFPCNTANPADYHIGTGGSGLLDILGTIMPQEVGSSGCRRLDQALLNSMARDRMMIHEHIRLMEATEHWGYAARKIEVHGNPVFD